VLHLVAIRLIQYVHTMLNRHRDKSTVGTDPTSLDSNIAEGPDIYLRLALCREILRDMED